MLITLLLASAIMLMKGCGGDPDGAKLAGCPSGSMLANTGDIFSIVPGDATTNALVYSSSTLTILGGSVSPLVYQVMDEDGFPRNNICVKFYTDGFFWAQDDWYSVAGPLPNPLTVATDESGIATLYWSTEPLLVSNPATSTSAGTDKGPYTSFVQAYSGPLLDEFTYNVTISGCPSGSLGSCP